MASGWRDELYECGDLVQDDDERPERRAIAEQRWNRYVALADAVDGTEGADGIVALVASFRAEQDYGAYEAGTSAFHRFPPADVGTGIARAGGALLGIPRDNSGAVLLCLARWGQDALDAFHVEGATLDARTRTRLRALIADFEDEDWLSDERGLLVVPDAL